MKSPDRILTWLLRLNGSIILMALVPLFFPLSLMAEFHRTFGLGTLTQDTITAYMARSLCACYAMHGSIVIMLSTNVRAYRKLIDGVFLVHILFAFCLLGIDLHAGMPWWWMVIEVGIILAYAVAVLFVNHVAKRKDSIPSP